MLFITLDTAIRSSITVDRAGMTVAINNHYMSQTEREYERAKRLKLRDVNAAIDGALEAGVEENAGCDLARGSSDYYSDNKQLYRSLFRGR